MENIIAVFSDILLVDTNTHTTNIVSNAISSVTNSNIIVFRLSPVGKE